MRLIDADALWEIFREKQNSLTARCGGYRYLDGEDRAKYDRLETTLAYIENAPEVDPESLRPRGKWVYSRKQSEFAVSKCSICGKEQFSISHVVTDGNYCPNCGAKMEDKPCG